MVGIGETIKSVFSSDDHSTDAAHNKGLAHSNKTGTRHNRGISDASGHSASSQESLSSSDSDSDTRRNTTSNKLASGTGVGTTGHAAHGARPAGGMSGAGDKVVGAGAVTAGGLAANKIAGGRDVNRTGGTMAMPPQQGIHSKDRDMATSEGVTGNHEHDTAPREGGPFKGPHAHGHNKLSTGGEGIHIPGQAEHDTNQLQHVTHENVRHVETEEVLRQKEHDRHVHHVKHHVQPVLHKEVRDEEHHNVVHPVTRVNEKHSSNDEDTKFLNEQVKQHKDTLHHAEKERTVIDKGTVVNEKVHHHVHHVVQPVVEQETVDRHRIHTIIPSQETTHEAPVIHHSEAHAPVSMDAFMKSGGAMKGAVGHENIASKVLHGGDCDRQVDGPGESLAQKLHLGGSQSAERRT